MNESAGKTPQPIDSQPAQQGAAQPPQPSAENAGSVVQYEPVGGYATEGFLRINVPRGADLAQIKAAVDKALDTIVDLPFFPCCPPQDGETRPSATRMAPCEILWMCMRQEGP